jgi:hypothetical protein
VSDLTCEIVLDGLAADAAAPAPADDVDLEAGVHAASPDADCCYICMDEDAGANGVMLTRICACTTTAVHAGCLEKVLNSKKSRAKPLVERYKCTVCGARYTVPLEAFVLSTGVLPLRIERFFRTRTGHLLARPLLIVCFILHITIFAVLLRNGATVFAAIAYLVAVSLPTLVFQCVRDARRKRIEELNDVAFHELAVAHARREARLGTGGASAGQVGGVPPASVILLVRLRPQAGHNAPISIGSQQTLGAPSAAVAIAGAPCRAWSIAGWRSRAQRAHLSGSCQRQRLHGSIASACPDYILYI